MRTVFLDSVGLLATWDTRDQWHSLAEPVFEQLLRERAVLLTTDFVLAECGNAASRKPYRSRIAALRKVLASQRRIIWIDGQLLDAAWNQYAAQKAEAPGIVDLMSFIVMRQYAITEAFTNDSHFKTAGFITLF